MTIGNIGSESEWSQIWVLQDTIIEGQQYIFFYYYTEGKSLAYYVFPMFTVKMTKMSIISRTITNYASVALDANNG